METTIKLQKSFKESEGNHITSLLVFQRLASERSWWWFSLPRCRDSERRSFLVRYTFLWSFWRSNFPILTQRWIALFSTHITQNDLWNQNHRYICGLFTSLFFLTFWFSLVDQLSETLKSEHVNPWIRVKCKHKDLEIILENAFALNSLKRLKVCSDFQIVSLYSDKTVTT